MSKPFLATVVNFCSNESRFLKPCLEEALRFSRQVVVVVCDHFFDGTPEQRELLETIYTAFPECHFVEYPFIPKKIPARFFKMTRPSHFWHSLSRFVGLSILDASIETVLFLDADEVPEGDRFAAWLDHSDYRQHLALKLANYWYFREPTYQALRFEDSVVLAQKRALNPEILLHERERDAVYDLLPGPKRRGVTDEEGRPMFHHFSWVRTKAEMLKKVSTWGHRADRDWTALVEQEFAGIFQGKDFIHGYSYQVVESPFSIALTDISFLPRGKAQVTRLTASDLLGLIQLQDWNLWDWLAQIFISR